MDSPDSTSRISTFRLRRRTPGTFVIVPCRRLGRSIRCQGQLEAAAARVLAACPQVVGIQEQPLSIWYAWRDNDLRIKLLKNPPQKRRSRLERYSYIVPDFLVTMQDGTRRLLEIKPSAKLQRPLVQRKLAVARKFAEQHSQTFQVLTERQLFAGPLLDNVRLLGRFNNNPSVDAQLLTAIVNRIVKEPMTLEDLIQCFTLNNVTTVIKAAALHLAATGQIDLDMFKSPISHDTVLYPGGTLPWDPFDSVWAPSGSSTDGPSVSPDNGAPMSL